MSCSERADKVGIDAPFGWPASVCASHCRLLGSDGLAFQWNFTTASVPTN